ncbi:universal stress protein [Polynucleobacter brandtiae]|uniref:Nucleotide-binding universal stress UspA family protein n=1 Tax=Polynucleobacter brandtiae TaxID=1938816 RepID=A0A2M8VPQ6_9BURK|nr:universal stress protein [Polynucleobacter brandtiae]PJI79157.1 nucleotide-binding universal stress UspA family protein [Polynucleobacter brandtiae]
MKILVAVDGSKTSLKAVKYAITLAKQLEKKPTLTLINVHDDEPLNRIKNFVGKTEVENYLIETSQKELKPTQKILNDSGIKHSFVIELGHISESIVNFANKGKFDLIIMGGKGRTGIADVILGSVTQRVSSLAKQPVLLIK